MANNKNDFFVEFGSNAREFGPQLASDLSTARNAVIALSKGIDSVITKGKEAAKLANAAGGAGGPGATGSGTAARSPGGQAFDSSFFDDIRKGLAHATTDIQDIVTRFAATSRLMEAAAGKVDAAAAHQNRSNAQINRSDQVRGANGRILPAGAQGGTPLRTAGNGIPAGAKNGVTLLGTPEVIIQDAAFAKVVSAIDAGTREQRGTRVAVERLVARLNGAPGSGAATARRGKGSADEEENPNALRHQIAKRQRLAAMRQELERSRAGGEFDEDLFKRATGGSKRLQAVGKHTGFTGERYEAKLQASIGSLEKALRGVPRVSDLRAKVEAIQAAGGDDVGLSNRGGRRAQRREVFQAAKESELALDKLAQIDKDIAESMELVQLLTGDAADAVKATLKELRVARATISSDADAAQAVLAEKKRPRSEQREINREEAAAARRAKSPGLSKQQRRDTQRDLDLGTSEQELRKLRKDQLRRVASSFGQEGYPIGFDPRATKSGGERVTNERLIKEIIGARSRFDEAGGTTRNNLRVSDSVEATEVSPEARRMVSAVLKVLKRTTAEVTALDLIDFDRETGGRGVSPRTRSGKEKLTKGRAERGNAFGGGASDFLLAAERTEAEYRKRGIEGTLGRAAALARTGSNFDPYNKAIGQGITGNGPEAAEARTALAALRRSTTAIDKVMTDFIRLDKEVVDLTRSLDSAEREMTKLERSATQTPEDADRLDMLREQVSMRDKRIQSAAARRDDLMVAPGLRASELNTPEFRQGLATRSASRDALNEARDLNRKRIEARQEMERAVNESAADALTGQRQRVHVGNGNNQVIGPDKMTSALPGLRRSGNSFQGLDPSAVDPELLKKMNSYFSRWTRALKVTESNGATPEEAKSAVAEAVKNLDLLLKTYEKMGLGTSKIWVDELTGHPTYSNPDAKTTIKDTRPRSTGTSKSSAEVITEAPGGGGKKPPRTPATTDVPSEGGGGTLDRILKRLDAIHLTLKSGVVTKAATPGAARSAKSDATAASEPSAPRPVRAKAKVSDEDAAARAAAAAAIKERKADEAARKEATTLGGRRSEARGLQDLTVIYGRLTTSTRTYIDDLKRMKREGADVGKIAEQQLKVFNGMSRDLNAAGNNTAGTRAAFKQVMGDTGTRVNEREIDSLTRSRNIRDDTGGRRRGQQVGDELGMGMGEGAMDAFSRQLFGNNGFWSRVMNSTGTFIIRNFTAGFVFGLTNALQDVVQQAIETESVFIRVSHALEATGRSSGNLRQDLTQISTDYGVALLDVYETAGGLTGLFDDTKDIASATRIVAQLEMISSGALTAKEGMGALASISSAFDISGIEGLEHIADVLTTIQNRLGVNLEVSAEGVGRLAGLANQIGLSFEETAVYVSEIAKKTNQTGAASGEQFSRMVSVMQTGRGQKVLTDSLGGTGIDGALATGDYSSAIRILMENYQNLTKAQQDNIATTIGGQRQAASFAALLKDGAGALDTIAAAQYSRGTADARAAKISETLNKSMERLQQNFVNLGSALVQTGILNGLGAVLVATNTFLGGLNSVLGAINDITGKNDFIRFLKDVGVGAIGAMVAFKLLRASVAGVKAAMKADNMTGAVMRGFVGRPELGVAEGGAQSTGRTRLTPRERITAAGTRVMYGGMNGTAGPGLLGRRQTDPLNGPTTAFGRGLETVTSGPLKQFGTGLTTLGTNLQTVGRNQAQLGLTGRATASTLVGRGLGPLGRGVEQAGYGAQAMLRGRGFEAAGQAMQRNSQRIANAGSGAAMRGLSASSNVAGRALVGVGNGLSRVSSSGVAAQAAMSGLAIVITAVVMEMMRASQFAKEVDEAYKARFTKEGRSSEEEKAARYLGPSTELSNQNREGLGGFGGYMRAFGSTFNPENFNRSYGEIADRAAGVIPQEVQEKTDALTASIFERFQESAEFARLGVEDVEDVRRLQVQVLKELDERATEIANDGSLSGEQKASALADLESTAKYVERTATNVQTIVQGLGDVERLTTERMQSLAALATGLASSPGAGQNYATAMDSLLRALGASDGDDALGEMFAALTSGTATATEMLRAQLAGTEQMIDQARLGLDTATEEEDIKTRSDLLLQFLGQAEQQRRSIIESEAEEANELATWLSNRGDYAGAVNTLRDSALSMRNRVQESRTRRAAEEYNRNLNSANVPGSVQRKQVTGSMMPVDEEKRLLAQADSLSYETTDKAVDSANREDRMLSARTRNSVALAGIQLRMANRRLTMVKDAFALGEATDEQVLAAEEAALVAGYAAVDSQQALIQAQYQAKAAGELNSLSRARTEEAGAFQAMAAARRSWGTGSIEYLNALAAARSASQATIQAAIDEQAAARETQLAMIAPGDMVGRANQTLANARAAQADSARFGQSSVQYQQATQQLIEAQRGVTTAVEAVVDANSNLAVALATAAGRTVDVARLRLEQAQQELVRAQQRAGGARSAEVINAEGNVTSANAALRDATLQDRLDTIDFQKNMDQITSRGAISMLTELLNMKDLTEQQRRDILLKIKGLQDELSSTMEGVFNLPENIKVPTVYEVRRAMGVDDYLASMKDATAVSGITGPGTSGASAQQILREIQAGLAANGPAAAATTVDHSHSGNTVNINGASFDEVVKWLQNNLGQGAQVVRTNTPRRY